MALIREGTKTALLIVDVQVGVMKYVWEPAQTISNINCVLDKARSQGIPVIWIQHSNQHLLLDSPEWQLVPELVPESDELQIDKHFNSAFEETTLDEFLEQLSISHIVLCGAETNWCIRATAYAALDKGYDLTLIKDAHTTEDIDLGEDVVIKALDIIRDLNVVMAWVSYPDRTSQAVEVEALDFTLPNA
jgi:nicotinamidase-related amidase